MFKNFLIIIIIEGQFGDIIGCVIPNDNPTSYLNQTQIFDNEVMCIDYCLKNSLPFAGEIFISQQCFNLVKRKENAINRF